MMMMTRNCAYCGKDFSEKEDWPYVEGNSNRGVLKIEHCWSEEHKHTTSLQVGCDILNLKQKKQLIKRLARQ
jgi:hypothetical protein